MGSGQSIPKVTAQDKTILEMKLQRDKLRMYMKKIQVVLDQEQKIAVDSLKAGNKEKALTALRRRKFQESLLKKTDGQLEVLGNLVSNIEFALIEKDVLFGLQQGNEVLKQIHSEMNLESVHLLMEDTAEAIQYQREVDEALMSKMTADEEESVQAELAALQSEALPTVPQATRVDLPEVPTAEPTFPTPVETVGQSAASSGRVALEA